MPPPASRGRINLTRQNVMEEVTKFQDRMERELGAIPTFRLALLCMIQTGEYYPGGEWVTP